MTGGFGAFWLFVLCALSLLTRIESVDKLLKSDKFPKENIEALEKSLLKVFGLKSRPKGTKNIVVPDHMWELYQKSAMNSKKRTIKLQKSVRQYGNMNTVRSHVSKDIKSGNPDEEHKVILKFNVSNIGPTETIIASELRLHRTAVGLYFDGDHKHRIDVHEIIKPARKKSGPISRLIDSRIVDVRNSSWESFDITEPVNRWRNSGKHNHGLEVHFLTLDGNVPLKAKNHVRLRRSIDSDKSWSRKRPVVMTYSDDGTVKKRRTRETHRKTLRARRRKARELCRRRPLYVDFSDVGWNDWIVAPPGYQAYFCSGHCPFPLSDHLNSTNHAIVQNLVNSAYPKVVPKACCVPTELSPISMLYVDEYEKVVLKNYQDMVVEGCGCR